MTTDLNEANGWIPEPKSSEVLTKVYATSAVESVARRVTMTAPTVSVPRFESDGADIVAEHAVIPVQDATLDEVVLREVKFANRFAISIEDQRDALVVPIHEHGDRQTDRQIGGHDDQDAFDGLTGLIQRRVDDRDDVRIADGHRQ